MTSSTQPSLSLALREILWEIQYWLQHLDWKGLAAAIWWSTLFPIVVVLTVTVVVLQTYLWIDRRWIHPPTARDIHKQALLAYQQIQPNTKSNKTVQRQHVCDLLQQAIRKDCNYQPAYQSLAALYLYQEPRHPDQALRVLSHCPAAQTQALRLDALAIQQDQVHMVQDVLRRDEYLSVAFCETARYEGKKNQ